MSRSRDVHRADRLAARDVVQIWALSLLLNTVPVTGILLLHPSVDTLREGVCCFGLATAALVGLDVLLLLFVAVRLYLKNSINL
jgi:uncharacterized membrane protein YhhN